MYICADITKLKAGVRSIIIDNLTGFYETIIILSVCGCKTVRIGGSGKVGDVHGGGTVIIDVPEVQ